MPAEYGPRDAQTDLKALGYYRGRVDGIAGPATRRAILQAQSDFDLPGTGAVDDALYATMFRYAQENPPHPDLPPAAQVFALQRALTRLGHYTGPADGRYLGDTLKAYLLYQRDKGLTITHKLDGKRLRRIEAEAARS
jgi:peptidoglycan hydrolase-like protein with peptidoglycan-binding domain